MCCRCEDIFRIRRRDGSVLDRFDACAYTNDNRIYRIASRCGGGRNDFLLELIAGMCGAFME